MVSENLGLVLVAVRFGGGAHSFSNHTVARRQIRETQDQAHQPHRPVGGTGR